MAGQTDLSMLENDKYKSIFYQKDSFSDLSTVAFSIVVINRDREEIETISSSKGHAEIAFIEKAKNLKALERLIQGATIEITINLSKSPCFRCREELEYFFESLIKKKAKVSFTLRIANLYFGDGGVESDIIKDLEFWYIDLRHKEVVCSIKPISVTQELKDYKDQTFTDQDWKIIYNKREKKDIKIRTAILFAIKKLFPGQVGGSDIRKLFEELRDVKELLTAEGKKNFYISQATRAVAVAQVKIKEEKKEQLFRPIVNTTVGLNRDEDAPQDEGDGYQNGCCATIPSIKGLLDEKKIKPASWVIKSSTIALAVTHFPCDDCLARITSDLRELRELKPRLILRVANIPKEEEAIVDWLFELDQERISVELHPINVTEELGTEDEEQWKLAKKRRQDLDKEAEENVKWINNKLSERRR